MKKVFLFICFSFVFLFNTSAVGIYKYISDSGHEFYYTKCNDEGDITMDEILFINAQIIQIVVNTNDPNYDKEKIVAQAKELFKDTLRIIYEENKDYMFKNFPDYKYTFDEVYSIVKNFTQPVISIGFFGYTCTVDIAMNIRNMLACDASLNKIKKYPYILGYLYQKVKYFDGEKCKIQSIPNAKVDVNRK